MEKQHRVWHHPKGVVLACDGDKLRDILYERKISFIDAAKQLKIGKSTFSKVYCTDHISSTVVALLEQYMNINPSSYNVHYIEDLHHDWHKSDKETANKNFSLRDIPETVELDDKEIKYIKNDICALQKFIKKTVKEAVKEAFDEL